VAKKVPEWGILYLLYDADHFQIVSGFQSKSQAIRWAKANNLDKRADEWEVFRGMPKGSGGIGMGSFIGPFSEWYEENKNSDELRESYQGYCKDVRHAGGRPVSFKTWAKGMWKSLREMER